VLLTLTAEDEEGQARLAAFRQSLERLGWNDGNLRIDVRWAEGEVERIRQIAADLVALAPDVIVSTGNSTVGPLL
jgi:putative ABC transport system substrate-binding protein